MEARFLAEALLPGDSLAKLRRFKGKIYGNLGKNSGIRSLVENPNNAAGTVTSNRINALANVIEAARYLEIGISSGETVEAVDIAKRVGVDPSPLFATDEMVFGFSFFRCFSDTYFVQNSNQVFDAVLIDGLHTAEQTMRDVANSLRQLSPKGFIVIDDTVPIDVLAGLPSKSRSHVAALCAGLPFPRAWMGDVFRIIEVISTFRDSLRIFTATDGSRKQTVIWPIVPNEDYHVIAQKLSMIQIPDRSYADVFSEGVPESFGPVSFDEILKQFKADRL